MTAKNKQIYYIDRESRKDTSVDNEVYIYSDKHNVHLSLYIYAYMLRVILLYMYILPEMVQCTYINTRDQIIYGTINTEYRK